MLRGINVGGGKIIKMADLKAMYESLGFNNVVTYIQSGNVIFASKEERADNVCASIVAAIKKKFKFDVSVLICEPGEIEKIIKKNPFIGQKGVDEKRLYVTFLSEKPSRALVKALAPLTSKSQDEYRVIGKEIYLHCPGGYGVSHLSNNFFEKQLKVTATTRNWTTVNILASLARPKSSKG